MNTITQKTGNKLKVLEHADAGWSKSELIGVQQNTLQMFLSTDECNQLFPNEILHVQGTTHDAVLPSDKLADANFAWH
jgi:hypothetical protein